MRCCPETRILWIDPTPTQCVEWVSAQTFIHVFEGTGDKYKYITERTGVNFSVEYPCDL